MYCICTMKGAATLVLWYGGYLVYHSELTAGSLTSLMLYTLNLAMAFGFLSSLYGDFMKVTQNDIFSLKFL